MKLFSSREPRPEPGDVRLDTCSRCGGGIWASQVRNWCGSAKNEYQRTGQCQQCQGKGSR